MQFSIGRRTTDGSSAAAALEIIAGNSSAKILEIGIALVNATASIIGLGRPAAKGITPTAPVLLLGENSIDGVSNVSTAVAWATGPTVPTSFQRRISLPAVAGSFIVWTFKNGLLIPAGASMVLWNLAANSVLEVYVVSGEQS